MIHRIDDRHQLPGAARVAQLGEGHSRPDRCMRILAAIFTHAGHIPLDITGVHRRFIERRIEQLDQACSVFRAAPHQSFIQRIHRQNRSLAVTGA